MMRQHYTVLQGRSKKANKRCVSCNSYKIKSETNVEQGHRLNRDQCGI